MLECVGVTIAEAARVWSRSCAVRGLLSARLSSSCTGSLILGFCPNEYTMELGVTGAPKEAAETHTTLISQSCPRDALTHRSSSNKSNATEER